MNHNSPDLLALDRLAHNQLTNEPSAYLRQHADNPVHWQPWNSETLAAAKALNRPILLSIGYAACHWCHVMAHESFEDANIAERMNALFVNIKVDREERPDIDQIYMAALSAMGQQGGWPLTMFLRPDGKAFWGGTYFPSRARHGMPGFTDVLHAIDNLWQTDQEKINHNAKAIFQHLENRLAAQSQPVANEIVRFDQTAERIAGLFDPLRGGIDNAPKFPNAPFMEMLWLSWLYTQNTNHKDLFLTSLKTMLQGGIYDHLGGGLCRYSTDADWLVPHFEKMLYDNAQMIRHANWAYAATKDDLFRIRIEETVDWLINEIQLPDGSFASSLDADSEGEEGKYYVWGEDEIDAVLGEEGDAFKKFYGVTSEGNWEGRTILNRLHAVHEPLADPLPIEQAKEKLRSIREHRIPPARDEKALTDWNALAIRALAEAGRSLSRPDWINHAIRAYRCVTESFWDQSSGNKRLAHCRMNSVSFYPALSTDYASIINAALSLYEATWDKTYIEEALAYKAALDAAHLDSDDNYRLSALEAEDIILNSYGDYDEAIPSSSSQIVEALTRLFLATGDAVLYQNNETLIEKTLGRATMQQYGQIGILNAARIAAEPLSLTMVIVNNNHPFVALANQFPDPRRFDKVFALQENTQIRLSIGTEIAGDQASAFFCEGHICQPKIQNVEELQSLLTNRK